MKNAPLKQEIMTILELKVYETLMSVEEGKIKKRREPIHTLILGDDLLGKVARNIGYPVSYGELMASLTHLALEGRIHLGETSQDKYAKIIYKEIISSL